MGGVFPSSCRRAVWLRAYRGVDSRAQSSVVGLILLFGITVIGVTAILVAGATALTESQDDSAVDRAELAMTQLDSQAALVALGDSERQRTTVELTGRGSSLEIDEDAGWMNISVKNQTTGAIDDTIMNVSMGVVRYRNGDVSIAYQGGGVWRKQDNGSVMVSPPEFHYRTTGGQDPTLTLPLVVVRGSGSPNQVVLIEQVDTIPKYPIDGNPDRSNPLTEGEIVIKVHTEYYEAWGSFFEERTEATVSIHHGNETVEITLSIQGSTPGVGGAIVSGASGGSLVFQNQAEADSYDSDVGPYSVSSGSNTSVIAEGDVELQNQAILYGNLEAGGSVTLKNQAEIQGNLSYGGTLSMDAGATVTGTIDDDAEVDPLEPVDWLIDDKLATLQSSNDNDANGDVDNATDTLESSQSTWRLDALGGDGGQYYLTDLELETGDELIIDTDDGDVEIVVTDDVTFQGDSKVRVTGPGVARLYLDKTLVVQNQANVSVPDDKSPQLWFYMNPGQTADFQNQATFIGVVYGPGSGAQPGVEIGLGNTADVKGGLVGEVPSVDNGIGVHFDQALADEDPLGGAGGGKPPITYLHVTVNEVNVTAG